MRRFVVLILIGLLLAGSIWLYQSKYYGKFCKSIGGKWSSANSMCVTKWCYKMGSCGKWPNPEAACSRLSIGDSIDDVFFVLGDPDKIERDRYLWMAQNRGDVKVSVIIRNEVLKVIICANAKATSSESL